MAAKTRLSLDGYGAKRAGSFAGKTESQAVIPSAQILHGASTFGRLRKRRNIPRMPGKPR